MGAEVFQGNIATCPQCSHTFSHNKVNGVALITAVSDIDARKRMRCRLVLNDLENLALSKQLTFNEIKKIFLDGINDFNRDVQTILGLDEGAE
jgi:hypothetical protein